MRRMHFGEAIDKAVADAMAEDDRIIVFGEDVHMLRSALFTRFGQDRVIATPISESAFVGAAVGAAMTGLRPIVELMMVDFAAVAMDAILNHMAKLDGFTGGQWHCPLVVRAACGAGYGDGGQHGQTLWGMLSGIPGLTVVVPSTPEDAYGLMRSAISTDGPVIFLEHKLLSEEWLDFLGRGGRDTVHFDVPHHGAEGNVSGQSTPIGCGVLRREGKNVTIASLGVSVHRALQAAAKVSEVGIGSDVIDLRSTQPLDVELLIASAGKTGALVVVDEDYRGFGLAAEIAAIMLENGLAPRYRRVCVEDTLPYARHLEDAALPNVERITAAVLEVCAEATPAARVADQDSIV